MYSKLYRRMRGITLTELLIVMVIVAILVAVGYPNYRQFAARAKRTEAKSALLQIATQQERFYLQNNTYTEDMTVLGFPVADNFLTDSESYVVDVTAADANNFAAQAVYQNADAEADKCASFTIDARGTRTSAPLADCWSRSR